MSRQSAIDRAAACFDDGSFERDLSRRVLRRTESQNEEQCEELTLYLEQEMLPAFAAMGFSCIILRDPTADLPFLIAERFEGDTLPTVLGYGHGDVVRGQDEGWAEGLSPFVMSERNGRWYGRGTADNKGQHSVNMAALKAVLETRGRLGFNAKYLIEMGEERGSPA